MKIEHRLTLTLLVSTAQVIEKREKDWKVHDYTLNDILIKLGLSADDYYMDTEDVGHIKAIKGNAIEVDIKWQTEVDYYYNKEYKVGEVIEY